MNSHHTNPVNKHDDYAAHQAYPSHAAHDKHAGHHTEDFLKRFWICLILTVPVFALSPHDTAMVWISISIFRR